MILSYGAYRFFFDMNSLPKGELISQVKSQDGTYTMKAYRTNGGATVSYAIRGELNYNNIDKKPKNIYWNYKEDKAIIEWIDEDTVVINRHELDVLKDRFDFRNN